MKQRIPLRFRSYEAGHPRSAVRGPCEHAPISHEDYLQASLPDVVDLLRVLSDGKRRWWSLMDLATAWQQRFVPAQRWRLLRAIEVLTTYRWLDQTCPTTWMARPEYAVCYALTRTGTAMCRTLTQKLAGASRSVRVARSVRCSLWRLLNNRNCDDLRRQVKARMRQARRIQHQQVPRRGWAAWFADHLGRTVIQVQAHAAIGVTDEERLWLFRSRPSRKPIGLAGAHATTAITHSDKK